MLIAATAALWIGEWVWALFVALLALGVLWEWASLALVFSKSIFSKIAWVLFGAIYLALAAQVLIDLRTGYDGIFQVGQILVTVIGVDVGAYFAGRTIGGPKIAPSISPSKTWTGLAGGAIGGGMSYAALSWAWPAGLCEAYVFHPQLGPRYLGFDHRCHLAVPSVESLLALVFIAGVPFAIVAQAGDFFESWMKRRAGVKDSGKLIPGHGGLFDRLDGLLAVCFVFGLIMLWAPLVLR
jgi:phosphatidate cytidylyltransferase